MLKRGILGTVTALSLAAGGIAVAPAAHAVYSGADTCFQGYVWRQAGSAHDHACVTPKARDDAAADTAQAQNRVIPGTGTCIHLPDGTGYVWREAWQDDQTCVTVTRYKETQADNAAQMNTDPNLGPAQQRRVNPAYCNFTYDGWGYFWSWHKWYTLQLNSDVVATGPNLNSSTVFGVGDLTIPNGVAITPLPVNGVLPTFIEDDGSGSGSQQWSVDNPSGDAVTFTADIGHGQATCSITL